MMFGSVSEHFTNPRHVKDEKLMLRAWIHYFGIPKLWSIHSSTLDPNWCLGLFRSILLTLGTSKMKNSCVGPECTISGVPMLWSIYSSTLDPKWSLGVFRSISLTLGTSKMKNSYVGLNALFRGYQSCEASILVHWSQNDLWECFGAFREPSARQRGKTHVLALNTLFQGTKVVKHPF
jgi:hypothetical protein